MKRVFIAVVLLLSGCASTAPRVVSVPIAVPCAVEIPAEPTLRFVPPYSDIFDAVRDLLGDRQVSLGYAEQLLAAVKACK